MPAPHQRRNKGKAWGAHRSEAGKGCTGMARGAEKTNSGGSQAKGNSIMGEMGSAAASRPWVPPAAGQWGFGGMGVVEGVGGIGGIRKHLGRVQHRRVQNSAGTAEVRVGMYKTNGKVRSGDACIAAAVAPTQPISGRRVPACLPAGGWATGGAVLLSQGCGCGRGALEPAASGQRCVARV